MFRTHLLAAVVVAPLAVGLAADKPPPPPATDAGKREVDLLNSLYAKTDAAERKKLADAYPFVSLKDRLAFDAPGRGRVNKAFPTPDLKLPADAPFPVYADPKTMTPAAVALVQFEQQLRRESRHARTRALAAVHELKVNEFIHSPGFGHERLVWMPSHTPDVPPKDWSEADRGEPVTLPADGGFFTADKGKKGPTMPAVTALAHFHAATSHEFVTTDSWGLVKKDKTAAGFKPHALAGLPDLGRARYDTTAPKKDATGRITGYPLVERWAVRRVELIGLLMHDSPVVYLNPDGKLPAMDAAKDGGTRDLTEFETTSLKDLAAGKDVVAVDAVTNHVRMVGAIRMASACLKCHEGKRGDLLGAFTYDLVRDPAFVAKDK